MEVPKRVRALTKEVSKETRDVLDEDWSGPANGPSSLMKYLFGSDFTDTIMILAMGACRVFAGQPMLVEVGLPCKVFGDIHGQLRDLLILFSAFGFPGGDAHGTAFVFNGDFVDRGRHQLEVLGILLALKIVLPNFVWLVRGNHEDRLMNQKYGFRKECDRILGKSYGLKAFQLIHKAFDQLPLACLIAGRILVVHGGIGDGKWSLNDVLFVQRPLGEELYERSNSWIFNILWSDPLDEDDDSAEDRTFGVHKSDRSCDTVKFGVDVTKTFCARNGLCCVIRSHQCKAGSSGFDMLHEDMLLRVFSARDYEGIDNDGAVVSIEGSPEGEVTMRAQVLRSLTRRASRRKSRIEKGI